MSLCLLILILACQKQEAVEEAKEDAYFEMSIEERQQPENATLALEVAEGLDVQLFASEPMVINPTNIAIDERGRVWVCESYNYALAKDQQTEPGGRITILEDTDQDGIADQRTVFYQGEDVHLALGISVFGDQIFVARSPDLLVFTDEDGDDSPDRKEVLFTGMGEPGDHSAHAVVFGPDGRFYYNYGNAGRQVLAANGDTLVDLGGNAVISNGNPYHGGMIFRFDQDAQNFEVLGHNFRNNYEVAIDAFGNLWQSDNDDDGNKGVRINYILEYGNYGYLDEMTGAHWTKPRTGMHLDIPFRHWHQNDPGVVPNLLHTGAGSPAGIMVYEGSLLPQAFQGQLIHADAGPSVVRAYPALAKGAGYTARSIDLLRSTKDQWFRPVDVAAAPDGSIFVADWYDPIVGGAAAGDHEKGRIFRIAPPKHPYPTGQVTLSTLETAIDQLGNPNMAVQYAAWMKLYSVGYEGEELLRQAFSTGTNRVKARVLWLLGQLPGKGQEYVQLAAKDEEAEIRVLAIRLARQLRLDPVAHLANLAKDPSPAVRRELAISLRHAEGNAAAALWTELALQYDGEDRWYLEALGIGAAPHWDTFLAHWLAEVGAAWDSPAGRAIIWRSRASTTPTLLARLIIDPSTTTAERERYFRAFDFQPNENKAEVLLDLVKTLHPKQDQIRLLALQHMKADPKQLSPALSDVIGQALQRIRGTWQFVDLVAKFKIQDQGPALLQLATDSQQKEVAAYAAQLLVDPEFHGGFELVRQRIHQADATAVGLLNALHAIGKPRVLVFLQEIARDESLPLMVRKAAIRALGSSWPGEEALLEVVKKQGFPKELQEVAASILFSVYRTSIHAEAAEYLDKPGGADQEPLAPIRVLATMEGELSRGRRVFETFCQSCHQAQGEGISFGPDLSLIGNKLSKEGLYRAIMYPSEGINYNYESWQIELASGETAVGLLASETDSEVDLKFVGGSIQTYSKTEIVEKRQLSISLMPNLSRALSEEQLVDLVTYLARLDGQAQLSVK